jgi:hypothetical protein
LRKKEKCVLDEWGSLFRDFVLGESLIEQRWIQWS